MAIMCSGQCCRNPYGVCAHRHQCEHHAPERRAQHHAERAALAQRDLAARVARGAAHEEVDA